MAKSHLVSNYKLTCFYQLFYSFWMNFPFLSTNLSAYLSLLFSPYQTIMEALATADCSSHYHLNTITPASIQESCQVRSDRLDIQTPTIRYLVSYTHRPSFPNLTIAPSLQNSPLNLRLSLLRVSSLDTVEGYSSILTVAVLQTNFKISLKLIWQPFGY